jgi:hypothetical protein
MEIDLPLVGKIKKESPPGRYFKEKLNIERSLFPNSGRRARSLSPRSNISRSISNQSIFHQSPILLSTHPKFSF